MRDYKIEVWITAVCFILVAVFGGFISVYFVIANERFFDAVEPPPYEELAPKVGEDVAKSLTESGTFFVAKEGKTVMGFPSHYFWLLVFSWLGATLIGAVWSIVMDRVEIRQRS